MVYGRRPRTALTKSIEARGPNQPIFGDRLYQMGDVNTKVRANTEHSRRYNRERLNTKATQGILEVGDSVVIKVFEPPRLTQKWDPQWEIVRVMGQVITLINQRTGKMKTLNAEHVKLVDPDIVWDEIRDHPRRRR
jgi:hypothetical protein